MTTHVAGRPTVRVDGSVERMGRAGDMHTAGGLKPAATC